MDSWDDERLGQYTDRLFMDLENENRTQSRSIAGPAQFVTTPAPRMQSYNQPKTIHAHHQRAPRMELLKVSSIPYVLVFSKLSWKRQSIMHELIRWSYHLLYRLKFVEIGNTTEYVITVIEARFSIVFVYFLFAVYWSSIRCYSVHIWRRWLSLRSWQPWNSAAEAHFQVSRWFLSPLVFCSIALF